MRSGARELAGLFLVGFFLVLTAHRHFDRRYVRDPGCSEVVSACDVRRNLCDAVQPDLFGKYRRDQLGERQSGADHRSERYG